MWSSAAHIRASVSLIAAVPRCLALGAVGLGHSLGGYKQDGTEHGSFVALALCFVILNPSE